MAIVAIAIKFESPGPVFERQQCVGIGGRRFDALTFRTTLQAAQNPELTWYRASQMTRMGPYLRYIGIDDLPRLFNVLRGEMSIIDGGAHSPSFLNQTSAPPWLPLAVDEPVDIETTGTRVVYENKSIRVREDTIRRRDGPSGIYSVVEKPHFVVNVPVEGDGRLHLVEQFRYPVRGRYIGNSPGLLGAGTRGRPAGSGARRITGGDWSRRRHDVLCRPSL